MSKKIGAIVLAAGASRRLGQAKQLLRWDNRSLIQRSVTVACASMCNQVVVVLGANANQISREIRDLPIEIIRNPEWEIGMSSSLKLGIATLSSSIDAVIIMLCDQPLITPAIINQLIQAYHNPPLSPSLIVACQYNEVIGAPALFDRLIWPALQQLEGDTGARKIIQQYYNRVITINCPEAALDIDTADDWEDFLKSK